MSAETCKISDKPFAKFTNGLEIKINSIADEDITHPSCLSVQLEKGELVVANKSGTINFFVGRKGNNVFIVRGYVLMVVGTITIKNNRYSIQVKKQAILTVAEVESLGVFMQSINIHKALINKAVVLQNLGVELTHMKATSLDYVEAWKLGDVSTARATSEGVVKPIGTYNFKEQYVSAYAAVQNVQPLDVSNIAKVNEGTKIFSKASMEDAIKKLSNVGNLASMAAIGMSDALSAVATIIDKEVKKAHKKKTKVWNKSGYKTGGEVLCPGDLLSIPKHISGDLTMKLKEDINWAIGAASSNKNPDDKVEPVTPMLKPGVHYTVSSTSMKGH